MRRSPGLEALELMAWPERGEIKAEGEESKKERTLHLEGC